MPILLLLLASAWSGTLYSGASAPAVVAGHLALLGFLWFFGGGADPLSLGHRGRWAVAALWLTVLAALLVSRVPRAGFEVLILLPAWLWLPAALAASWRRLDRLLAGVAAAVAVIAGWALVDWMLVGAPRPAMPLGHHNLLAAWLVILLPVAALAAHRRGDGWKWALWGTFGLGLAAVVLSRSLIATLALGVEAILLAWLYRPLRRKLLLAGGLLALVQLPRLASILGGTDSSASARSIYRDAARAGWAGSPWWGQGPGSVGWTSAEFLRPRPGLSPPSEVVGQLHSLPLDLLYQLGGVGAAVVVVLVTLFVVARWRELSALDGRDRALAWAGLIGLAGGAVAALGNSWLHLPAMLWALALALALLLRSTGAARSGAVDARWLREAERVTPRLRWPLRLYLLAALLALLPLDLARGFYDRARSADSAAATHRGLSKAVALDPSFPLYRARLAALSAPPREAAAQARRAARIATSTPPLWLQAGVLSRSSGMPALEDLRTAMALDPLAAYAPFELALALHDVRTDPQADAAAACLARALLAEPRLAAAVELETRPGLLPGAIEWLHRWPGVDAGWRVRLVGLVSQPRVADGERARLVYAAETGASPGLSLYGFRRLPWPQGWLSVPVRAAAAQALDLPPATTMRSSTASAFPADRCAPPPQG